MIYVPVDFTASSLKSSKTTTTTPLPPSLLLTASEIYTNYLTAFSDFCNYASLVIEKIHETFTLVNENLRSKDCSKFNELADMLRDARADLNDYVKFKKNVMWTFEKNSKTFLEQSLIVPSMARFKAIKIGGYQNFTDFLCRDIEEASALMALTERTELSFRMKSCFDCRGTEFFHPVFCSAINFVISTPKADLSDGYATYLEELDIYLNFISTEVPSIFKNFAKCSKARKLSLECITTISQALESLDDYMNSIRGIRNIYDITALFFTTLKKNSLMDHFIDIQIGSHGSRSRFLAFEHDYLQTIFDKYSQILFNGV
jgi:hypothetical protein